ncbi:MAG: 2Fe-2S iron-sulfur cluster binding domain-containing protein [Deltaproteobacteria bacterium]|nr:2Fe-2S iron-sulfur cluster binding domain-containing protein [Deltaproteobacteria bacterium]
MGGSNPYLSGSEIKPPKKKYKIRFMPMNKVVEVDPAQLPFGDTGLSGSILDIAMHFGIPIDHACGGVCACSTCHVFVKEGKETCNEAEDFEYDMLDTAPGNTIESRLSCQCVANGEKDLVVEIPGWNKNLAKEGEPSK